MYEYPSPRQAIGTRTNAQPVGYRPQPFAGVDIKPKKRKTKKDVLMNLILKERFEIERGKEGGIRSNMDKLTSFDNYLGVLQRGGPEADNLVKAWEAGELEGLWSGYAKQATPNMPPAWS